MKIPCEVAIANKEQRSQKEKVMNDCKYRIQCIADSLAEDEYKKDFYDLPEPLRGEVYDRAEAEYADQQAGMNDAIYDRMKERMLLREE